VLTLGRRGSRQDVLWSDEELDRRGIAVCDTPRGGQVTLHAPGQLVVYPVVRVGREIRQHLRALGEVTIALVEELGVESATFSWEHPGVWAGESKIASVGIHVSRGVAIQGLSLNLRVDHSLFAALVSCGLPGVPIRNVVDVGGRDVGIEQAARRWAALYANHTRQALHWVETV